MTKNLCVIWRMSLETNAEFEEMMNDIWEAMPDTNAGTASNVIYISQKYAIKMELLVAGSTTASKYGLWGMKVFIVKGDEHPDFLIY